MTAGTIRPDRLLRFPMTFETGVVRPRHRLERMKYRRIGIRWNQGYDRQRFVRHVAERTVVVVGLLVLWHRLKDVVRTLKTAAIRAYSPLRLRRRVRGDECRNHVLMFVVRKLDLELPLVFKLRSLVSTIRFTKSEPAIFARRRPHMTDCANCGAGTAHCLTREELRPVATHTRIVIRKIRDIGECAVRSPGSRNPVTGVALQTLVFVG